MTPVLLLTGFLGSGKTTLLQRLLVEPSMAGAAVLINEFGEVGLDHHLLDRIDDNVVLLKSGCICCTVRGEVADALSNLDNLRSRGDISFDRVVIETTGLADPYPVLQTLTAHPVLRSHFTNGGVLTTVDAVNGFRQTNHRSEAVRQITAADRIVLTKVDLVDAEVEVTLRARLAKLHPAAQVLSSQDDVETILGELEPARLYTPEIEQGSCGEHRHHHHHDEPLGITSFSMLIDGAVDWTMFGTWLTLLLHKHGDKIYRVKGILALEGEERPVAIHGVQHLIHAPTHMEHWPKGKQQSQLIFILEGVSPDLIRRSFTAFIGTSGARAEA